MEEKQQKKERGIAKWICFFLAGLAGVFFLFSVILAFYFEEEGYYTVTKEEKIEELYKNYSNRYSAYVMENLGTTKNQEYFAEKNFCYGVVQADNMDELKKLDLNNKKNYVDTNFDKHDILLSDLQVFECNLSNRTTFRSRNFESLNGYIYMSDEGVGLSSHYEITQYVYDKDNGIFYAYVRGNNTYYRIDYLTLKVHYEAVNEGGRDRGNIEKYYVYNDLTGKYQPANNIFDHTHMILSFPNVDLGQAYRIEEIEDVQTLLSNVEFSFNMLDETWLGYSNWFRYGVESQFVEYETIDNEYCSTTISGDAVLMGQIVIGKLPDEDSCRITDMKNCNWLPASNMLVDWSENQENSDTKHYFVLSYVKEPLINNGNWKRSDLYVKSYYFLDRAYNFSSYEVFIVMGISFVIGLFTSIYVLVTVKKKHWINRIPLEIFWVVFGMLFLGIMAVMIGAMDALTDFTRYIWYVVIFLSVYLDILIAFGVLIDFVIRVKAGEWWKNTVCYYIYQFFKCRADKIAMLFITGNQIATKIIVMYSVLAIIETAVVKILTNSLDCFDQIFFWFIWKIIVGVLVFKWFMRWKEIKDSEIQEAVSEKVKSERFQTELITNVSHDIKTPLTSVINYVDLLKKEEMQNEQASQYIEVLDRQSVRLKKLIEDLIEASKASTGNLSVNLERLDAKVFLIQTIGEFEEKIESLGLQMIINQPEEEILIEADGRHLWRVIDNLMNNICKYAQPQTRVYIDLVKQQDTVQIIFKNTSKFALNISSEELMRRFVRGDASRNTEGSGLGLSIALNLMQLMGGQLKLFVDGDLFKVVLEFEQ